MRQWLADYGVNAPCAISPYVDKQGQPAVLIQINSAIAHAMITSLNEQLHTRRTLALPAGHPIPHQRP